MVQGAGQAKGCAVKVAAPDVKGEQELAGEEELAAPAGQGAATDGQHILQPHNSMLQSQNIYCHRWLTHPTTALFSVKMVVSIQAQPAFCGDLDSGAPGNSKNTFLHCGDVPALSTAERVLWFTSIHSSVEFELRNAWGQ